MTRWFARQTFHRKLVLMSVAVTTTTLVLALVALLAADFFRYRQIAISDAASLARLTGESTRVALAFSRPEEAQTTMEAIRLRPQVRVVCLYDADGVLFTYFERDASLACARTLPREWSWMVVGATSTVSQGNAFLGTMYVERDWSTLLDRLVGVAVASGIVLVLASVLTVVITNRLTRGVSSRITDLAAAARRLGQDDQYEMPDIERSTDEVGQLVDAFTAMVSRVHGASEDLKRSNEALRREVDERRRMQADREVLLKREREANRLKDEFLAVVSHELRTPLNAILGWSHILATTDPEPDTIARAAKSLYRNAQAQTRVIDDLLDISRIVTGKLRVELDRVDLRGAVEVSVEGIQPQAAEQGVQVRLRMPESPVLVRGDQDRLRQTVWNLLSNAVKFTPAGGAISVTLREEGDSAILGVADTGVGIPAGFLPHVFDRFRQADASMTRERGGLGIGLAVVKELVGLHGGHIVARSGGDGKGSEFVVTLPLAGSVVGQASEPGAPAPAALPSLDGVRVLVVDDNDDALHIAREVLARAGASVELADSGAAALEIWTRQPPDVLVCDLAMPGMSGYELLGRVREIDRRAGRLTPALAVTAQVSEEQIARSVQAGFQVHIAKPFEAVDVIQAVAAAMERV
jgi:signal transduction histidine kinase